jgi:hypothetical protein
MLRLTIGITNNEPDARCDNCTTLLRGMNRLVRKQRCAFSGREGHCLGAEVNV